MARKQVFRISFSTVAAVTAFVALWILVEGPAAGLAERLLSLGSL